MRSFWRRVWVHVCGRTRCKRPNRCCSYRAGPSSTGRSLACPNKFERVLVVTHYLSEQVEAYLRQQKHFTQWQTVRQETPRGTGDALLACREQLRSERFLALNGDDLFGAADLAKLASCSAGVLCHPVEEPRRFGIAFRKPDGTLDRLVEKPDLEGRYLANTGAYMFPRTVFEIPLTLSPRGEYEVTQYVTELAKQQPVQVVEASFWLPIGTVEVWQAAQTMDLRAATISER